MDTRIQNIQSALSALRTANDAAARLTKPIQAAEAEGHGFGVALESPAPGQRSPKQFQPPAAPSANGKPSRQPGRDHGRHAKSPNRLSSHAASAQPLGAGLHRCDEHAGVKQPSFSSFFEPVPFLMSLCQFPGQRLFFACPSPRLKGQHNQQNNGQNIRQKKNPGSRHAHQGFIFLIAACAY